MNEHYSNQFKLSIYLLFVLIPVFLSIPLASSQGVGIGLNNYLFVFNGTIFDSYTVTTRVINPGDYEISARVSFECFNCVEPVEIFGHKIGDRIDDYNSYFTFETTNVTVPPKTRGQEGSPVIIYFSPKIITKKYFRFNTPEFLDFFINIFKRDYDGNVHIPYFSVFIGEKYIKGLLSAVVYSSSFGSMGVAPSVGAGVEMTAKGIPLGSFIFLVIVIVLVFLLIFRKKFSGKKTIKHKPSPKKEKS
jgi:hypothetical protein